MKLLLWVVEMISPRFDPVQELRGSKSHAMRELLAKAEREEKEEGRGGEYGQPCNVVRR